MVQKQRQPITIPINQLPIILAIAMAVGIGAISLYGLSRFRPKSANNDSATPINSPTITSVAALGRLEPQGEVINLSAPNSQGGVQVAKLLVDKGDKVRKGQAVALLDNFYVRLAALENAKQQILVAQASLNQVKAGAKAGDIAAQKATIARLEAELDGEISTQQASIARLQAELRNAKSENQRYQMLYKQGAISASDADAKRLRMDTVQQQLNEAKANRSRTVDTLQKQLSEARARLESIAEVRPTDVQAAQAEVEKAKTAVVQARADLDLSIVRSPVDGQIIKIYTWPGEIIGNQGIAQIGYTDQMYVVAEVYETDIKKVHLGQLAIISSDAFSGKLQGTVTDIGLQVTQQNIFSNNPGADTDNKVVDVKIRINNPKDNERVAALTNLQVEVLINLGQSQ
ncbi:MAG: ABC exporter membrane fusion protein [Pelatocladus maniniholoensis HA4357-MV3]|jgi:HlyD family secretion protein|uniref:ABC exporter membrane fusion protein n=1 Tax=Pelatocladus maniniholoensis HA4357-MV3 TaxID=1117104 RepID=A0A9E3LUA2_9NOST|nr:ABC exporter membrane fusion protein [Pelatocladus maniniholoensis HA4357-MV3]BAZ66509.1 HlyD family secretion protein [Fischerella sp. NIES-4106]